MKREEVLRILRRERGDLRKHYAVASLFLFGSVARNQASEGSDVDLLVEFEKPVGLIEFIGLKQRLESLLGSPVDLGTPRSLKPAIKEQVLREAIHVT
jgi:predicted nucleotidyltransferase